MKNEFFDEADCPFEVIGFSEEFDDVETGKFLGARKLEMPTRPPGSPGRVELTITEPLKLVKNFKDVVVKASPQKPLRVRSIIQIICGRTKGTK